MSPRLVLSIADHLLRYDVYRRAGWHVIPFVWETGNDAVTIELTRMRPDGRDSRSVSTPELSLPALKSLREHGDDQILGYLRREFGRLFAQLFPAPLPTFRIGLRAPKRLQPPPEKRQ